jgi:hypothetical protein
MDHSIVRLYLRSWRVWWLPALLLGLLAMLHQAWLQHTMPVIDPGLSPVLALPVLAAFAQSGAFWYPLLALILGSMLPFTALVLQFDRLLQGQALSGSQALRATLPLWPAAMLTALCYGIVVMAGTLLLLIPGVWLGGRWLLWPVALVRNHPGLASLEHGAALLKGRWWRVNSWVTVVTLVAGVASLLLDALIGGLPAPLVALLSWTLTAPLVPLAMVLAARGEEFR